METKVVIHIKYGSEFQSSWFSKVVRWTLQAWSNVLTEKHKKNSITYNITTLVDGVVVEEHSERKSL